MRLILMEDGETYGTVEGCVVVEIDSVGLEALESGDRIGSLVESGRAHVVADFVNGEYRLRAN